MSLRLAEGAEDAALTRNEIMLRELFRDHFDLADIFTAGAREMKQAALIMKGSENQPGLFDLMQSAASELAKHAGSVNTISRALIELEQKIEAIPLAISTDREVVRAIAASMQEAARESLPVFSGMQKKLLDSVSLKAFGEAAELKADALEAQQDLELSLAKIKAHEATIKRHGSELYEREKTYNESVEKLVAIHGRKSLWLAIAFAFAGLVTGALVNDKANLYIKTHSYQSR